MVFICSSIAAEMDDIKQDLSSAGVALHERLVMRCMLLAGTQRMHAAMTHLKSLLCLTHVNARKTWAAANVPKVQACKLIWLIVATIAAGMAAG